MCSSLCRIEKILLTLLVTKFSFESYCELKDDQVIFDDVYSFVCHPFGNYFWSRKIEEDENENEDESDGRRIWKKGTRKRQKREEQRGGVQKER